MLQVTDISVTCSIKGNEVTFYYLSSYTFLLPAYESFSISSFPEYLQDGLCGIQNIELPFSFSGSCETCLHRVPRDELLFLRHSRAHSCEHSLRICIEESTQLYLQINRQVPRHLPIAAAHACREYR